MAVATPVLEKKSYTQELEDIKHDSLIKERYAKLVNPDLRLDDLKDEVNETQPEVREQAYSAQADEFACASEAEISEKQDTHTYFARPYLAPSGRADADIFRVDSDINKRLRGVENVAAAPEAEEEDNEDLKPTPTTIQYKTENMKRTASVEEGGKISTDSKKHLHLSNRDIIIIAAVVTVIVALFVLIIVNSAIISGINKDLGTLQSSLNTVKGAYSSVSDQISDYMANHLEEDVKRLGESLGMVK